MSKHTPGPWRVKPAVEFADSAAIVNDRNYCIARLNRSQLLPELANARLIAAAPDLLAICQKLAAPKLGALIATTGLGDELVAAIAKAKGGGQ